MDTDPTIKINPAGQPGADLKVGGRVLPGGILGVDYRLEQLIGRGGCGSVYLAHDLPLDRKVAVKIVGVGQDPTVSQEAVQRFMREARAVASVEHPNIVPVYRVGKDQGFSFIVMQYIKGQTLTQRLQGEEGLGLADILLVSVQIAAALECAHQHGLVHRDIKPSNVMIDEQGYVKVMDFGLARTSGPESIAITHTGMFVGTPRYSSPEQCETTSIDCRSDLYSLGVIMYEMLAGTVPHEAETPLQLMHKIVHEPPPPLQERNPSVPAEVQEIVLRLLAKNPVDRYPSATALLADLRSTIAKLQTSATASFHPTIQLPADPQSGLTGSRVRRQRRLWLRAAAAAALVVVVGLLAVHFRQVAATPAAPAKSATAPAVAPENQAALSLAIYDFDNATKDPELGWLEIGMPDMLAANLSQYGFIQVHSRDEVLWSVNPRPARFDASLRQHLLPLKVEYIANGTVYRDGKQLRFVVNLFSLDGGRQLGTVEQRGTVDGVFKAIDALAGQILQRLHQTAMKNAVKPTQVAARPTHDLVFAQHFVASDDESLGAGAPPAAINRIRTEERARAAAKDNAVPAKEHQYGASPTHRRNAAPVAPGQPPAPATAAMPAASQLVEQKMKDGTARLALPAAEVVKKLDTAEPAAKDKAQVEKVEATAAGEAKAGHEPALKQAGESDRTARKDPAGPGTDREGADANHPVGADRGGAGFGAVQVALLDGEREKQDLNAAHLKFFFQGCNQLHRSGFSRQDALARQHQLASALIAAGTDETAIKVAYDAWVARLPKAPAATR